MKNLRVLSFNGNPTSLSFALLYGKFFKHFFTAVWKAYTVLSTQSPVYRWILCVHENYGAFISFVCVCIH